MPTSGWQNRPLLRKSTANSQLPNGPTESSAPTPQFSSPPYPVGADDSVRPQKYTNFTEIFGEFTQSKAPLGLKGPIGVGMLARSA